jgi:2-polyprenyl-3-methyl-5-hydroxy-6-metoxy-1,4-benzoquinol methylase
MFSERNSSKELLDGDAIPEDELRLNLKELHTINKYLGGYGVSRNALRKISQPGKNIQFVDIGCGGGDLLAEIRKFAKQNHLNLRPCGIDNKAVCRDYSKERNGELAEIVCDDYRNLFTHFPQANVVHASLFCHHLSRQEIVDLIRLCISNSGILLVNDLERHPLAYYSIKMLTGIFSGSRLVKHDAPLSVLRGFKKREWISMLLEAGAKNFSLKNKWAFRHQVIVYPQ